MPYCGCSDEYMKMNYGQQYGMGWVYQDGPYVDGGNNSLFNPWLQGTMNTGAWMVVKGEDGEDRAVPNPEYRTIVQKGMGLDVTDVTGGFSLQTILLIAGVGLVGWMMLSARGGREYEYRQAVVAARSRGNSIKKKVDSNVREVEGYLDSYRRTGSADVTAMGVLVQKLTQADDIL